MKVEIWSDFMCPFCYIGKRKFEAALEQFPHRDEVEVVYRSFELDPHSQRDSQQDVHGMLAAKYGMSREQAVKMNEGVAQQAQAVGLTFRFGTMVLTNTFDAHRLAHFAASRGRMHEMTELLLRSYFTDSRHIGDHTTLAELAGEAGLDPEEAAGMLAGDEYAAEVRADEQEAARLRIQGVPFFVLGGKYAVSGAQPSSVFLDALQQAWAEEKPLTLLNPEGSGETDAACADGVCAPPAKR